MRNNSQSKAKIGENAKEKESFRAKFEVKNAGGRSSVSPDLLPILREFSEQISRFYAIFCSLLRLRIFIILRAVMSINAVATVIKTDPIIIVILSEK